MVDGKLRLFPYVSPNSHNYIPEIIHFHTNIISFYSGPVLSSRFLYSNNRFINIRHLWK